MQTLDEALAALKRGEPIHLSGADALVLADRLRSTDRGCSHRMTPDKWEDGTPLCRECGRDMSSEYEMGD